MNRLIIRLLILLVLGLIPSILCATEEECSLFEDASDCESADGCQVPSTGEGCEPVVDVTIGDICYCLNGTNATNVSSALNTRRRLKPQKRRLGSSKSKKSKGSSDNGYGVGDCDCDKTYGMNELRVIYQGSLDGVDIQFTTKDDDSICSFDDVNVGEELTCNLKLTQFTDSKGEIISKFTTNTYFEINGGSEICEGSIHTSCSSDIVGTTSSDCDELFVTGWKDGNPNDDNDCDDGLLGCDCDDGSTFLMDCEDGCDDDPETDTTVIRGGNVCYCSNLNVSSTTTTTSQPFTTTTTDTTTMVPGRRRLGSSKSKKSKKSKSSKGEGGYGHGDCDCKDGMSMLRFVYIGTSSSAKSISIYYGVLDGPLLCMFNDTEAGDEIECALTNQIDNEGDPIEKMSKNTYLRISYLDASMDDCDGSFHTSCSRDIVGYTAEGCNDIVVTGWDDNEKNTTECDDGYERCSCPDDACGVYDNDKSECNTNDECCWSNKVNQCYTCNTNSAVMMIANQYCFYVFVFVLFAFCV